MAVFPHSAALRNFDPTQPSRRPLHGKERSVSRPEGSAKYLQVAPFLLAARDQRRPCGNRPPALALPNHESALRLAGVETRRKPLTPVAAISASRTRFSERGRSISSTSRATSTTSSSTGRHEHSARFTDDWRRSAACCGSTSGEQACRTASSSCRASTRGWTMSGQSWTRSGQRAPSSSPPATAASWPRCSWRRTQSEPRGSSSSTRHPASRGAPTCRGYGRVRRWRRGFS